MKKQLFRQILNNIFFRLQFLPIFVSLILVFFWAKKHFVLYFCNPYQKFNANQWQII